MAKKRGKYGTEDTYKDEYLSKEIVIDIYLWLCVNEPINGWEYVFFENGISEHMYYKRDGCTLNHEENKHYVVPDFGAIILRNINNKNDWYLVLSGEDKYQETGGNAIERTSKNYEVFKGKICYNSDILPYIICVAGKSFVNEDGEYNKYFLSKFRQMLPYVYNGKPSVFNFDCKKTSFKDCWNRLYIKRERFTKKEKEKIIRETAIQSVKYLRSKLE